MSHTTFRTNIDIAKQLLQKLKTSETTFQIGDRIVVGDQIALRGDSVVKNNIVMEVCGRTWHYGLEMHLEVELAHCFPHMDIPAFEKYVKSLGYRA